jgi:hypothetical protein
MPQDIVYKCDECSKEERWTGKGGWFNVIINAVNGGDWGKERRDLYVCSTACKRACLKRIAGEQPSASQCDAEARTAWPDLAKRLDEQAAVHAAEVERLRAALAASENGRIELLRRLDGSFATASSGTVYAREIEAINKDAEDTMRQLAEHERRLKALEPCVEQPDGHHLYDKNGVCVACKSARPGHAISMAENLERSLKAASEL